MLVFATLLIAGGFYFRQQSLSLVPHIIVPEEEGEVSGARTSVPENFPQDVPLFTPSETLSSLESQERVQITLQTSISAERVLQFYQQRMRDEGWQLTGRGENNGTLTFLKDARHTHLAITPDSTGPTLIILTTSP